MAGKNGGRSGPPTRGEFSELQLEVRGLRVEVGALREEMLGEFGSVRGQFVELREEFERRFDENAIILRQVLRAVTAGNERRDGKVDELDGRVRRLEDHAGFEPPDEEEPK